MVFCRMNQARSPFAEAVLRQLFPEWHFRSLGVFAIEREAISAEVRQIAESWKLSNLKPLSENLDSHHEYLDTSVVAILAESTMRLSLEKINFEGKTKAFDELEFPDAFIPKDPIGLYGNNLAIEMAKVALCSVQIMKSQLYKEHDYCVYAYMPATEADTKPAFLRALCDRKSFGGVIIDSDFRAPFVKRFLSEQKFIEFDIEGDELEMSIENSAGIILTPNREHEQSEAILLGILWKTFIHRLLNRNNVFIVTPPISVLKKSLADSYLAAIWSDSVEVIKRGNKNQGEVPQSLSEKS